MRAFSYLKCEVELHIDQTNKLPKKRILHMMASDKGLNFGVECSGANVLDIQLATKKRAESRIDSSIYEYLLSVVMLKWVTGMKIISLSFSEHQQKISHGLSVEERIKLGKCTKDHSPSDDKISDTSIRQECPEQPETEEIRFEPQDRNSSLQQVRKWYNSKLVEKIHFEYAQTKRTSSQKSTSSTASSPPLGDVLGIGMIFHQEDSVATNTLSDMFLNSCSDTLKDWTKMKASMTTLNDEDLEGVNGINGLSLIVIAQELIDFEGNKMSKLKFAADSLRTVYKFPISAGIAQVIVRWVYDKVLGTTTVYNH